MGALCSVRVFMRLAYAPQRGSRLSGKTREGISQGQEVRNVEGQG
jgi:hypothetical protein